MKKISIRILLSPIIFIWSVFFTAAMCLFPIPLLIVFSLFGLISYPFIYIIKKGGTQIEYCEPFLNEYDHKIFKNHFIANFTGILSPIIIPILITLAYIIKGKIILINEK